MKVAEEANKGLLDLYIDSHTRRPTLSPSPSSSKRHSRPQKPRETRSEKKERLALLATDPFPVSVPVLMRELGNSPRGVSEGGA